MQRIIERRQWVIDGGAVEILEFYSPEIPMVKSAGEVSTLLRPVEFNPAHIGDRETGFQFIFWFGAHPEIGFSVHVVFVILVVGSPLVSNTDIEAKAGMIKY